MTRPSVIVALIATLTSVNPAAWATSSRYDGDRDADGRRHGWGSYTYASGDRYEGEWFAGEKSGKGTLYGRDGTRYVGQWNHNQAEGKGIRSYPGGSTYRGDFKAGRRHGRGTEIFHDQSSYKGEYQDDKQHGKGIMSWPDGTTIEGTFRHGVAHGPARCTVGGKTDTCRYDNGRLLPKAVPTALAVANADKGAPVLANSEAPRAPATTHINAMPEASKGSTVAAVLPQPAAGVAASVAQPAARVGLPAAPIVPTAASVIAPSANALIAATPSTVLPARKAKPTPAAAQPVRPELVNALPLPSDLLSQAGQGFFFRHDFPQLPLAQGASHAWWQRETTLLSDSVTLNVMRGSDKLRVTVHDYRGPGQYAADQFDVLLVRGTQAWVSKPGDENTLVIETAADGWIEGHIAVTVARGGNERFRLSEGVFKLQDNEPEVATLFDDL